MTRRTKTRVRKAVEANGPATRPSPVTAARSPRRGMRSLVAAARRILASKIKRGDAQTWQTEIWAHYRECGELRFIVNSVANAMALAELYVAKRDPVSGGWVRVEDPNDPAVVALDALWGDSPTGMEDTLRRFGQHLFGVGESWLVGHPPEPDTDEDGSGGADNPAASPAPTLIDPFAPQTPGELVLSELVWRVYSSNEVKSEGGKVKCAGREFDEDEIVLIRMHRQDPEFSEQSDSPVRSSLPVLRELRGLTMHVSATVDSRLAGAGVFVIPASATALGAGAPEDDSDEDPVVAAIIEATVTPIKDRDSASAVVPLILTVPDEVTFQPYHLTFSTPFDAATIELRKEAIRRLALGLDAPPERLLGMGDVNHWSAWQLSEDEARLHVAPPLGIIRDALVREYLRPVLAGSLVEGAMEYTILADMSALTLRPDRSDDGFQLHGLDLISDDSLREVTGFGPEDAPVTTVRDRAVKLALTIVTANAALLADPGLEAVVNQIHAVLDPSFVEAGTLADGMVDDPTVTDSAPEPAPDVQAAPDTAAAPPPPPGDAPPVAEAA